MGLYALSPLPLNPSDHLSGLDFLSYGDSVAKLNESSLSKTRNRSIQFSYLDELSDQSF
ncbi:Uncharacterised protein [Streptococcus pneumoniae]|nr:Uncharacterised protein [Streptococcus pneumoniae]